MFLTGFDNKFLNTLYVDKNLQYHGLLQAFSRTNRLLNEKKKQGNIISFRNIKKETDESIKLYSDENAIDVVVMGPYEDYVDNFNNVSKKLFNLVENPQNVDHLRPIGKEKDFIEIFRTLLRIMPRLSVYTEFSFDDLIIPEQMFEDFKSKYLDIYELYRREAPTKTSVLDDIDFEIELLQRDNINVSYILSLLKELDPKASSFEKDKKFIIQTMENSVDLKSKVSLIKKFIDKNMVESDGSIDVDVEFEEYMNIEKDKAIDKLIKDEDLKPKITKQIISNYEFSEKIKNDKVKDSFNEELGLIKKRTKLEIVKEKIIELVEKFTL